MFVKVGDTYIPIQNIIRIRPYLIEAKYTIPHHYYDHNGIYMNTSYENTENIAVTPQNYEEIIKQIELDTKYKQAVVKFLSPET